jgi:hypothetical protein
VGSVAGCGELAVHKTGIAANIAEQNAILILFLWASLRLPGSRVFLA